MNFYKRTALAALVMGFSGAALALPNITILATGGTIAGGGDSATKSNYTAGKVGVENLVDRSLPFWQYSYTGCSV